MTKTVKVSLKDRSYSIRIGAGVLGNLAKELRALRPSQVFIISDDNVAKLYMKTVSGALKKAKLSHHIILVPSGEKAKSFSSLETLLENILLHKPDRNAILVALGGGVVGDITGFAASIILRGIRFIQVPTTLLAMVDSSVGGKTGINSAVGKNLIGSFYQPECVLADTSLLATLPLREIKAGYAEVVKYGLINKPDFFKQLEAKQHIPEQIAGLKLLNKKDQEFIEAMIHQCCSFKAEIVGEDEREQGKRALLNLGHTFGHALEAFDEYSGRLLHGEAVSVGMVLAFEFSNMLKYCNSEEVGRVKAHLKQAGLKISLSEITNIPDAKTFLSLMQGDKKMSRGKLVLILANGIGKSRAVKDFSESALLKFLQTKVKEARG